jgi:hypothetical protein
MPQLCQVFFLWTIEWLSDYCLTLSEQFLSYIMAGTSYIPIKWWWCLLFNRPTLPKLDFYSGSSLKHKSTVRSTRTHYPWCMLLRETANSNFIVTGLTQQGAWIDYELMILVNIKQEAQWAEPVSLTFHSALRKLNT